MIQIILVRNLKSNFLYAQRVSKNLSWESNRDRLKT